MSDAAEGELQPISAMQDTLAQLREEAEAKPPISSSLICSHCVQRAQPKSGYMIRDESDGTEFVLCCLRCMAIWAMTRGWKRA